MTTQPRRILVAIKRVVDYNVRIRVKPDGLGVMLEPSGFTGCAVVVDDALIARIRREFLRLSIGSECNGSRELFEARPEVQIMLVYTLRRIAGLVPTLFVLVTLSFFIIRLAPGGPFDQEQALPPAIRANLDAAYGLDQPLLVQYGRYLAGLARGDSGLRSATRISASAN